MNMENNYNTHNFTLLDEPTRYTNATDPKYINWLLPADRTTTGNIEEQNTSNECAVIEITPHDASEAQCKIS